MNDPLLWQIRHFVYGHFADTTLPPSVDIIATHFYISSEEAGEYYKELHNRHAFFLDLETTTIRMANPFSGIPTDFKVHADGKTYFANCAWDMLGIPATLHTDAVIEAVCTESNDKMQLEVKEEQIISHQLTNSQSTNPQLLIHFPLPFSRWYDDLVFT
ncbi:MAG TPA: organomercurial lyase [Anaerolineales bacterium]